jgi:anaerobic selenocysteine-containing dehydrogenase
LLTTCLQGVFQSNQATAAAVQVNNLNLVLGRIGRPGCGILQMNGQPTAQNTRETGADGDLSAFRNWDNPKHVEELARLWNVEAKSIPNWGPPTHALQIFRYCETGSIRMLWITATNPAVSMPDLSRVRKILAKRDLFVVVQDAFLTETAQFADLVLPAAIWGEKPGCMTNVSRVVHFCQKAVEPPGEARADLDIFLDYARRMNFQDRDGAPLIKWKNAEEAFRAWTECTRGHPCDYTGLSHAKLSGGSGIPWPCNAENPNGTVRLYTDLQFPSHPDTCESYGHDLETGAPLSAEQFRALQPNGRAIIRAAEYIPPTEQPDAAYPFYLTTGRLTYHFHTRTRTGQSPELYAAAPDAYVQINAADALELGIQEGDFVRVTSRRSVVEERARIGNIESGHVFIPFHYGYWDNPGRSRAANELTIFGWDPVSKQPFFKYAAVKLERISQPTTQQPVMQPSADRLADIVEKQGAIGVTDRDQTRHRIGDWLERCDHAEAALIDAFDDLRTMYPNDPDIPPQCTLLISWSQRGREALASWAIAYDAEGFEEPALPARPSPEGRELLLDLQRAWTTANEGFIAITVLDQAAKALQDITFQQAMGDMRQSNERQRAWLMTQIKGVAPQALVVPR